MNTIPDKCTQPTDLDADTQAGVHNLLRNCIGARQGESLLIIGEEPGLDYYDNRVCDIVRDEASALGLNPTLLLTGIVQGPDDIPSEVVDAMQRADHTVFFSRLGDQIRFSERHGNGSKTMCYALNPEYLRSEFSVTPYALYSRVHDLLLSKLSNSKHYAITCPLGTNLHADVHWDAGRVDRSSVHNFTVKIFPILIFPPLACINMFGNLAFSRFLMSTSINQFEDSVMMLDQPLAATIENSRIVSFHGDPVMVDKVDRHYKRVAGHFGGDPYALNSWHTGIYPKTYYSGDAMSQLQRWGDIAFGSPRYTHIHTCGDNPGNVACSLFDADISFDGEPIWQGGRFVFLDSPECQAILADYPDADNAYAMRWDIGL